MDKDLLIILGLFVNFFGVLFSVAHARVKIETRLTRVETMISMIARNCDLCQYNSMRSMDRQTLAEMDRSTHASK